jgi:hypothetical protein
LGGLSERTLTTPSSLVDLVVKQDLAPSLRRLGFKKQRRNFRRPTTASVQVINVQSSAWNFEDEASFTVNLGLYFPDVASALGDGPDPSPAEYDCHVRSRIGALVDGVDRWWKVDSEDAVASISSDLSVAVLGVGLQWLQTAITHEDAARLCVDLSRYDLAAILTLAAGDQVRAAEYLGRALSSQSPRRDALKAWSQANNLAPRVTA